MAVDAVWIDVLPAMDKFAPALGKGADEAAQKTGMGVGKKFGLAAAAGVAVVGTGAALAAKGLFDLGQTFDDMTDGIRVGTGATGEALDGLVESAKNISTNVPASFEDIGAAVADANTRLGLTGETLETFSSQFLEAGRMTGEALDMNKISASFNAFKIEGEDTVGAMDTLYRVSQDTGISINALASNVQKAGPSIQALGFDFEQTAALVGGLDKAGLDASRMTAGLSRSLVELAKDGEEPAEAFERVTGEIQAMAEAGDIAGATTKSAELFGTKNAPAFMQALQDGTLNLDELSAAAEGSGDTILGAAEDTASFGEQWTMFKNTLAVYVAPAAEKVFGIVSDGMGWIKDNAIPAVERFGEAWSEGTGPLGRVKDALGVVQAFIADKVIPWIGQLVDVVIKHVVPMAQQWFDIFQTKVLPVLKDVANFIVTKVVPVIQKLSAIALPIFKLIGAVVETAFKYVILPALGLVWDFIGKVLGPVISWLWTNIVDPYVTKISDAIVKFADAALVAFEAVKAFIADKLAPAFKKFGDGVAAVFEGLKAATAKPINFVINTIYNKGIMPALNLIPGVDLAEAKPIPGYRHGGYTGNIDPDEIAGVTHGREYVLTERETAGLGGPSGVKSWLGLALNRGYKKGGRVHPVSSGIGTSYRGHTGRDFGRAYNSGHGATVRAAGDGVITNTAKLAKSYGWHIRQRLDEGLGAVYAHLSHIGVSRGQRVTAGQPIGRVGNTGNSFGAHLHFGINESDAATVAFLRGAAVSKSSGGGGGGDVVDEKAVNLWNLLKEIPSKLLNIGKQVREGLTGEFGGMLKGGMLDILGDLKGWVLDKINPFSTGDDDDDDDPKGGKGPGVVRAYAGGTGHAQQGLARLGEYGAELITGPSVRYLQGGENITSASALRNGKGGRMELAGRLSIDEDGSHAYVRGVAIDVYDENESSARRWERMGG